MKKVASSPPFEFGIVRNILERMEELSEFCTQYTNTICGICSLEEGCDDKAAWRTTCEDYQDLTQWTGK